MELGTEVDLPTPRPEDPVCVGARWGGPGSFIAAFGLKEAKASFTHNRSGFGGLVTLVWGLCAFRFRQPPHSRPPSPPHTLQLQGGGGRLRNCHLESKLLDSEDLVRTDTPEQRWVTELGPFYTQPEIM